MSPLVMALFVLIQKYKEKEEELMMQIISWQEFEAYKQGTAVMGLLLFFLAALIAL